MRPPRFVDTSGSLRQSQNSSLTTPPQPHSPDDCNGGNSEEFTGPTGLPSSPASYAPDIDDNLIGFRPRRIADRSSQEPALNRRKSLSIQYDEYDTICHTVGAGLWLLGAMAWLTDRFTDCSLRETAAASLRKAHLPAGEFATLTRSAALASGIDTRVPRVLFRSSTSAFIDWSRAPHHT